MKKPILLKLNNISGIYYPCGKNTDTVLVYGIGGPTIPDNGNLPDAPFILKYNIDLFVPDYIGYGRSDGKFTPKNCVKTFLNIYDYLKKGITGISYYDMTKVKLKYKRILFLGRSLGGAYVPLLPKYNKEIKELCILYGAVDQKAQGKIKGEETNKDFMRTMEKGGFKNLYRGVMSKIWYDHLENKDGLSPMDNIEYLKNSRVFIAHGKKDTCINYRKSEIYFEKIQRMLPKCKNQFKLKMYPQGDHGPLTSNQAVQDFLDWIKV